MTGSNDNSNLLSYLAIFGILSEAVKARKKHIEIDVPIPPEYAQNCEELKAICRANGLEVSIKNQPSQLR